MIALALAHVVLGEDEVSSVTQAIEHMLRDDRVTEAETKSLLRHGPPVIRRLGTFSESQAAQELRKSIELRYEAVKSGAYEDAHHAINYFRDAGADQFVVLGLRHPSARIRSEAIVAIEKIATPRVFGDLIDGYDFLRKHELRLDDGEEIAASRMDGLRLLAVMKHVLDELDVQTPDPMQESDAFLESCRSWWRERQGHRS
ncbi:MAG: hypothetical protein WD069_14625 [Planctomycetales bacterium]